MRTLGAATVVLALAAGCTGDPDPVPTMPVVVPTATPSPSPTPDPATVPPERPDLSRVDAATAEALAVYFLELHSYAFRTGDLTEVRDFSHPDCEFCSSLIADVEEMLAGGYTVSGGDIETASVQATAVSSSYFDVELSATQSASSVYDASGALAATYEGRVLQAAVGVLHEGGAWWILGVDTTVGQ